MLDLTGRPDFAGHHPIRNDSLAATAPTLAELHYHVAGRTDISEQVRDRYLGAISKVGQYLNKPLAAIDANIALVEARFPLDGFDPDHWSSNSAYELFRRRFQASLREFLGVHA